MVVCFPGVGWRRAPLCPGQDDAEKAALGFLALELDAAVVRRDRPESDGETQAHAARIPGTAGVRPVKALENPLAMRRRDPRAGVLHFDRGLPGSGCLGADIDRAAGGRVLDRVVE